LKTLGKSRTGVRGERCCARAVTAG
jgi:hypothetical protein